eukprot:m.73285 g.73285  ORF g.73285 m.73285 type:complete len:459 (+) comp12394_c0_seq2:277-1653(+)
MSVATQSMSLPEPAQLWGGSSPAAFNNSNCTNSNSCHGSSNNNRNSDINGGSSVWSSSSGLSIEQSLDLYDDQLFGQSLDYGRPKHSEDAVVPELVIHRVNSDEVYQDYKAPKILGRYLFGDQLGSGASSKVKEVLDVHTLRRLAVKIMQNKKLRRIPHGQERAKREANILKKLRHRNVVELVDVMYNWDKQKIYFVMEYCPGTLQELLDGAPGNQLPTHQAKDYFAQLLHGLKYIHSKGVVHKDIKPGNLLLSNDHVLKISDFGVAEVLDSFQPDDFCTVVSGTTPFQPPEVVSGASKPYHGFKADVWASAVTLWNMVTGSYPFPFENSSLLALLNLIEKARYTIPDDMEADLVDLMQHLLRKDPEARFSVDQALTHRWLFSEVSANVPRVELKARSNDEDPDRGTTVVPMLESMHSLEKLKRDRMKKVLDADVDVSSTDERPRLGMFASLFRSSTA